MDVNLKMIFRISFHVSYELEYSYKWYFKNVTRITLGNYIEWNA